MFDLERLLTININDISRLDDLYEALDALAREARRVIDSCCPDARQLQELAQELARLRYWISVTPMEATDRSGAVKDIVARYLDLEGRVKELRDDHPRET